MTDEVKKLKKRCKHAQASTYRGLGADLAEATRRKTMPGNPRLADDIAIYNKILAELVRLDISEFNSVVNSPAVQTSVDNISKDAARLKREADRVTNIAKSLTKWTARIDFATSIVTRLKSLE